MATAVGSSAEMVEMTLEPSTTSTNWLPSAGNTACNAGTMMMKWKIAHGRNPSARPASICPRGTASMPARTISVA